MFFDNAAGAQIPQIALNAVKQHMVERNVPRGGRYLRSRAVVEAIAHARQSPACSQLIAQKLHTNGIPKTYVHRAAACAKLSPHEVAKAGLAALSVHPLRLDTAVRK
jgi:hypothetical protein